MFATTEEKVTSPSERNSEREFQKVVGNNTALLK